MSLAAQIAERRRAKAAQCWELAHKHPLGSAAYSAYLREHGEWIAAAQKAERGDTAAVVVPAT